MKCRNDIIAGGVLVEEGSNVVIRNSESASHILAYASCVRNCSTESMWFGGCVFVDANENGEELLVACPTRLSRL
jgi:hypothetical protein